MSRALFASTLQALKSVKDNPYVQYIGLNLANISKLPPGYTKVRVKKTRLEMVQITAAVCGIELCYAAETAFVSPILLKLGVPVIYMTWVWCLSPLLGFFLVPLLGSMSDRCRLKLGRRRPFILVMTAGIIFGLILVPNGEWLGLLMGDISPSDYVTSMQNGSNLLSDGATEFNELSTPTPPEKHWLQIRGVILTIIGVVMLDFNCDACQSPSRSYLLDVTIPEDHKTGIITFTVMAGLGGSVGYIMGSIKWNAETLGSAFEGHVRLVFTIVLCVFIPCILSTVTSVKETPLDELDIDVKDYQKKKKKIGKSKYEKFENESDSSDDNGDKPAVQMYGAVDPTLPPSENGRVLTEMGTLDCQTKYEKENESVPNFKKLSDTELGDHTDCDTIQISTDVTLKTYLQSIIRMPKSLFILCITNLFCWMSLVCYSLFFTDFVGQAVYGGDPNAPRGSDRHENYEAGVRLGSFAMSLYSFSCAVYSLAFERLVKRFKARNVYVCGQLAYSAGMVFMAVFRHPAVVILMSPTAGIMYATLFTMPYLLVANYHTKGQFTAADNEELAQKPKQIRGLGTDVALISSMVFVAQFLLSSCMGTIIHISGSTVAIAIVASILSFCGAVTATQVLYLDM